MFGAPFVWTFPVIWKKNFAFGLIARAVCRSNFSFEQIVLCDLRASGHHFNQVKLEFFKFLFEKNFRVVGSSGILRNLCDSVACFEERRKCVRLNGRGECKNKSGCSRPFIAAARGVRCEEYVATQHLNRKVDKNVGRSRRNDVSYRTLQSLSLRHIRERISKMQKNTCAEYKRRN